MRPAAISTLIMGALSQQTHGLNPAHRPVPPARSARIRGYVSGLVASRL